MGEEREEKVTPTKKMARELGEGKLLCKFLMKPMAKKTLILKCKNIKVAALTQDVAYLSKNNSELVDTEARGKITDSFKDRLQLSGYS